VLARRVLWFAGGLLVRPLFLLCFQLRAYGQARVPATGGVVIASNHQSYLDPPLLAAPLGRMTSFVARDTLFRNPVFGRLIRALNAFPVRRATADRRAVDEAIRRLKSGWAVILFPEATRTRDGGLGAFKPGVAMIAARAGVPIVPTAILGADAAWPRHGRVRCRPVRIRYGEPISVEAQARLGRREVTALLRRRIEAGMGFLKDGAHGAERAVRR
jgi:1-acyl-sn-glycerol-3-phosphate acyltransferase